MTEGNKPADIQSNWRFQIVDWVLLIVLVSIHFALRSMTIRYGSFSYIDASPFIIGTFTAIFMSVRGMKRYEVLSVVCLATVFATASWSFECLLRTQATSSHWNDRIFEWYTTDPLIQFLKVVLNAIVMTIVAGIIVAIVRYVRDN